jgi:TP901 family phage tail tape measure protein
MPANVNVNITATDVNFTQTMKAMRSEMAAAVGQTLALQTAMGALKMGAILGAAGLAAMVAPTLLMSKAVANYDTSLRRAIAIGGPTYVGQMNNLSEAMTDTAIAWGISSDEIAAGIVDLAKAGFKYTEVMNGMMTSVAQLSKIHQVSFEEVSSIMTYAFTLFGDAQNTVSVLADKMNKAANISILNLEDLGAAFQYTGSAALTAGMSVDQFLAMMSALSQVAQRSGQNIGTMINNLFLKGAQLEKELGLATGTFVKEGVMNMDAFVKYLSKLPDPMAKYAALEKMYALLGGVRSARVTEALMAIPEKYFDFLNQIGSSTGELEQQSKDMAESIQSTWTSLVESLMQPVKSGTMLAEIQSALKSLKVALTESTIPDTLHTLMLDSANFTRVYGPGMIDSLAKLASSFMDLLPSLAMMGKNLATLLHYISLIPAPMLSVIATMIMINKLLPMSQIPIFMMALNKQMILTKAAATGAAVAANLSSTSVQSSMMLSTDAIVTGTALTTASFNSEAAASQIMAASISTSMNQVATSTELASARMTTAMNAATTGMAASAAGARATAVGYSTMVQTTLPMQYQSMPLTSAPVLSQGLNKQLPPSGGWLEGPYSKQAKATVAYQKQYLAQNPVTAPFIPVQQQMQMQDLAKSESVIRNQTGWFGVGPATQPITRMPKPETIFPQTTISPKLQQTQLGQFGNAEPSIFFTNSTKAADTYATSLDGVSRSYTSTNVAAGDFTSGISRNTTGLTTGANQFITYDKGLTQTGKDMKLVTNSYGGLQQATQKTTVATKGLGSAFLATGMAAQIAAQMGMFAFMSGLMAIVSSKTLVTRALGAIAAAFGIATIAMIAWKGMSGPMGWKTLVIGTIASAAAVGAMISQQNESKKEMDKLYNTSSTSTDSYASGGFVEKTGLALIHKDEYVIPRESSPIMTFRKPEMVKATGLAYLKKDDYVVPVKSTAISPIVSIINTEVMKKAGKAIPKYESGGYVKNTGLALVHKDEYIVPKYYAQNAPAQIKQPTKEPTTNNYDYRTINIFDPNKMDLKREMRELGR